MLGFWCSEETSSQEGGRRIPCGRRFVRNVVIPSRAVVAKPWKGARAAEYLAERVLEDDGRV